MTDGAFQTKIIQELGSLYDAEHHLLDAMEQMAGRASDPSLRAVLGHHADETRGQIRRLEVVAGLVGGQAERVNCFAAAGLVADANKLMEAAAADPAAVDGAIAAAQSKAEHLEVACYRALIAGAERLGNPEVIRLLRENLAQEEQMMQLAEQSVLRFGRGPGGPSAARGDAGCCEPQGQVGAGTAPFQSPVNLEAGDAVGAGLGEAAPPSEAATAILGTGHPDDGDGGV